MVNQKNMSIWKWFIKASCYIAHSLFFIFLFGGQAMATQICQTASITASTPDIRFTVNANGTVTDLKTGLMWKQCSEGLSGTNCATGTATTYTWKGALLQAQSVNTGGGFAGFNDWRVPNINELSSIVEIQCNTPAINATIFPAAISSIISKYWSSSPDVNSGTNAGYVEFINGTDGTYSKSGIFYVRLVRGGQ